MKRWKTRLRCSAVFLAKRGQPAPAPARLGVTVWQDAVEVLPDDDGPGALPQDRFERWSIASLRSFGKHSPRVVPLDVVEVKRPDVDRGLLGACRLTTVSRRHWEKEPVFRPSPKRPSSFVSSRAGCRNAGPPSSPLGVMPVPSSEMQDIGVVRLEDQLDVHTRGARGDRVVDEVGDSRLEVVADVAQRAGQPSG